MSYYSVHIGWYRGHAAVDLRMGGEGGGRMTLAQARELSDWLAQQIDKAEKALPEFEQRPIGGPAYLKIGELECRGITAEKQTPSRDAVTVSVPDHPHHELKGGND